MVESRPHEEHRYLAIGGIAGPHGIRGEIRVYVLTDYPERFHTGAKLYIGDGTSGTPVVVTSARPHHKFILLTLEGIRDRNAAELLTGQILMIPEDEAMPLAENENYAHDLLGLLVQTDDGKTLGELTDILATGANDVYVVTMPETHSEVLIPALRDVVRSVDLAARRMVVVLPDGLLDDAGEKAGDA